MTRHKVEFEVVTQDGDNGALPAFASVLDVLLKENVPAQSGWAAPGKVSYTKTGPLGVSKFANDKRFKAIAEWIDEKVKTNPLAVRHAPTSSEASGGHKGGVYVNVVLYDDKTRTTKSLYIVSAWFNRYDKLELRVEGPYEDADDQYWISAAKEWSDRAIITPDWVHRTVAKDDPVAVKHGGGGHGGAEFRFKLLGWSRDKFEAVQKAGIQIDEVPMEDGTYEILTTHNCWYQGKIPAKHRHLFKVNAEMIEGFNPGVNV